MQELFKKADIVIPDYLHRNSSISADGKAWLEELPNIISHLTEKWSLMLERPFEADASCSWVAPCVRQDQSPAVLKIGIPHMVEKVQGWLDELPPEE